MNAVTAELAPAASPEPAPFAALIERFARDASIDVTKLEQLLALQERIQARNARAAYAADLARMTPDLPTIQERGAIKNNQGGVQSRYALWEDVVTAISPVLSRHGFALSFRTGNSDKAVTVTGVLSHREGHSEETSLTLPIDASGSKNAVQSIGSSVSYAKRYTSAALLNLRTGEVDDDGRTGGGQPRIDEHQMADLEALLTEVGASREAFLKYLRLESLDQLLASSYEGAIKALEAKRKRS